MPIKLNTKLKALIHIYIFYLGWVFHLAGASLFQQRDLALQTKWPPSIQRTQKFRNMRWRCCYHHRRSSTKHQHMNQRQSKPSLQWRTEIRFAIYLMMKIYIKGSYLSISQQKLPLANLIHAVWFISNLRKLWLVDVA